MFCVDWNDVNEPFDIKGSDEDDDHSRIEVMLVPCNYMHTELGYQGDSISPECIAS